jgi:adenylosuccinate synthase
VGGKLIVVSGAQFGSEGKGAVAAALTTEERAGDKVVAVRVAGPNAGHTVYGICPPDCDKSDPGHRFAGDGSYLGHPWRLRAVPVSAVSNLEADLVIAAGSEIDREVLFGELDALDAAGYAVSDRLFIDAQATILTGRHITEEVADGIQKRLGSTAKGIGAARADRVWRYAETWGAKLPEDERVNTGQLLRQQLDDGYTVMIEGTQGYGLGLHQGNYPQCTSSDCRAIDFLGMAGLSPWASYVDEFEVWLVARVRPIRVAGNSGPMKGETSWAELGLPEERTTVTKKVRRVGEWDTELVRRAVEENGGAPTVRLALTMADTIIPAIGKVDGQWDDEVGDSLQVANNLLKHVEAACGAPIEFVGTSPVTGLWR